MDARYFRSFPEMGRFTVNGPDESRLMGVRSAWPVMGGADWTCVREDHWLFDGTGMRNGDSIPGLVGWESHGAPADIPGLEVVAAGVTTNSSGQEGSYASVVFPATGGGLVFNTATIWWGDGLAEP